MKKAAIYLRVSTSDQNYERQEIELRNFASALGYEVKYVFEEKRSAVLSMDTREQLGKMRQLTKDEVDRIFIWDISRLSRRAIDFINLINEFSEKGICLHFKDRNIITLEEDGTLNVMTGMYLYLLGVFAQMDAENLKAKMKSGKEAALLRGNSYTNIAPFGYYLKDKHLYVKEEEAEFVRKAFELYSRGKDTQYIADLFNANNVPLKSGRKDIIWVKGTISQLLNNTVYYGKGKRETTVKKATATTAAEKLIRYFDAPAIISKELFDKCREVAVSNRCQQDKSRTIICLLRGLLKCGVCGKYYVLGNNNKQREYRDGDLRANKNNRIGCKNGAIKAAVADTVVWDSIHNIYTYSKFREKCIEEKERYRHELVLNEQNISSVEKEVKQITNQVDNLVKFAIKGLLSEEEFAKQKQELDSEKGRKAKMVDELKAENLVLRRKIDEDLDFTSLIKDDISEEEKKLACNDLIDNVILFGVTINKKILQVNLKVGLSYNILINTNHTINSYCILDDSVVTYNKVDREFLSSLPQELQDKISDFTVTSNNNELFGEEVFGEYSFDQIWKICKSYDLLKRLN